MEKNKQQTSLFYEDTKALKRVYFVLAVLMYIGFIFNVGAIVLYHLSVPIGLFEHYQPNGGGIIVTSICLFGAVTFSIMIVKSQRFNYYIEITESEIRFSVKGKLNIYETSDLKEYRFVRKYPVHREYVLIFSDKRKIMIITKKEHELKNTLNTLISKSDSLKKR